MGQVANQGTSEVPPGARPVTSASTLLLDGLGAIAWGCFFVIAPIFEVLVVGALAWIPILVWREKRRSLRHAFLPGFLLRVGVVAAAICAANVAPLKYEDRERVGPLSAATLPLESLALELRDHRLVIQIASAGDQGRPITLPSREPNIRQLIQAVESQTLLRYEAGRCGNSMSVLWGGYPISMRLVASPQR